ncbi:MAG: exo-alpha-sialidase [Spirochaetaceae bacterium]|nr:MAG: exo-alpha-sialidase [Spirochaetaceae bacterium]
MAESQTGAVYELWDVGTPFPDHTTMEDVPTMTHVSIERGEKGGYHYLHESSPAWHNGSLYVCWANHRVFEINTKDELIRYKKSDDGGFSWSEAKTWAEAPLGGSESYNHPVVTSEFGKLWGFFTRWDSEQPSTEIFSLDVSDRMVSTGVSIPSFVPFRAPEKMSDGNWILGGESTWFEAAVAISDGDDFTSWHVHVIPRPEPIVLKFPETTLMMLPDRIVAICRPNGTDYALVATSRDCGKSWTELQHSNVALHASQTYCGKLSSGQYFLISNSPAPDRRSLLSIAVTEPGAERFSRVWKIRHQAYPLIRLFGGFAGDGRTPESRVGHTTEWSYPGVIEHDRKLFISYTQGKEDCNLSIIPIDALRVRACWRT